MLLIGLIISLLAVIWQDFQQRSVHIGILVMLSILAATDALYAMAWPIWLESVVFNWAFIALQLLGISLYY